MRRLVLALFLLLAVCCTEPGTQDSFVSRSEAAGGIYEFTFQIEDIRTDYNFSFFTRVDGKWQAAIPLYVKWLSPSGDSFSETVYFRAGEEVEPYRSEVALAEEGDWRISVSVPEAPRGFRGLGMICKKNGTRQTP